MASNYWESVLRSRIARRRLLLSGGTATVAGLLLAACGSNSRSNSSGASAELGASPAPGTGAASNGASSGSNGLVQPVVDETANAIRGGIYKAPGKTPTTLDPHNTAGISSYSQLFQIADGHIQRADGHIDGDAAATWEYSPDKLTLTIKTNPAVKFAPVAPVNGRPLDAGDVLFSWQRFSTIGSRRGELVNAVAPTAPIESLTSPDNQTVVIKMNQPNSTIEALLANTRPGSFFIVPKEAADTKVLDLKGTQAGSGPWYLADYKPSIGGSWRRNPGYGQDKRGIPYMDGYDYVDIGEYAAILAQFKAGNLYDVGLKGLNAEDILQTKKDVPALDLRNADLVTDSTRAFFGQGDNNPFRDDRVRLAWTMARDRDAFMDVVFNVSKFASSGLEVKTAWDTALGADTFTGWWIDPKSADFGPNARYFKHDVAQAKQLLSAAGYPNGLEYQAYWPTQFAQRFYDEANMMIGMAEEAGMKAKINELDYSSVFNTTFRFNKGQFDGVGFIGDAVVPDPVSSLFAHYDPAGVSYYSGDDTLTDYITRALLEFDLDKRRAIVVDFQKYEGGKMYQPRIGSGSSFSLSWPAVRNVLVWPDSSQLPERVYKTLFLDPTKAPIKPS